MVEATATVQNAQGIHCRPSAVILKAAEEYAGDIVVSNRNGEADLSSVLQLLGLGLCSGDRVNIRVSGPDEEAMCRRFVELFETRFDFPPRKPGMTDEAMAAAAEEDGS